MHSEELMPHDSDVMEKSNHFSSSMDHTPVTAEDDRKLLAKALRSFPSLALKDLLSNGVCISCIFRIFGMRGHAYFYRNISQAEINGIMSCNGVEDSTELEELCPICSGILQFTFRDEKEVVCRKRSATDFASTISELVKQQEHVIDSFSLEVSVPPIIQENDNAVWSYLKKKYDSEICFQGTVSGCTSTKDALKLAIASPLETFLDVNSSPSSFCIRLTYTHVKASSPTHPSVESIKVSKRRKVDAITVSLDVSDSAAKQNTVSATSSDALEVSKSSKSLDFPFEKVEKPCLLAFSCSRTPIYIGGRYLKIVWEPYDPYILQSLPPYCLDGQRIWSALVPLICISIVEWHPADRVMRQFGYQQRIPNAPINIEHLHHVAFRQRQIVWSEFHAAWITLWQQRHDWIQRGPPGSSTIHYHNEYMEWYRRITRRWIGLRGASVGSSFSRNVSQTRWMIDDERMGEASVEEIIGGNILPILQGDSYKFHAAGREDIDVRMLGSGRPFLVEIQNKCQIPSEASLKQIETKINNLENKLVGVKNLKVVTDNGWNLMHEGESEKQKQYCALVWISRPLEDEDLHMVASLKDMNISQRTPVRVLHRRSPLERDKTIHWMKIEKIAGSSQYFLLHLCTQAGTYIKEFVHGDLGRTHPNIGSILKCRAEILRLDVTDVIMDCFLTE